MGINVRNLKTLEVNSTTHPSQSAPAQLGYYVAESSVQHRGRTCLHAGAGADAVLIGEALVRSGDLKVPCAILQGAGDPLGLWVSCLRWRTGQRPRGRGFRGLVRFWRWRTGQRGGSAPLSAPNLQKNPAALRMEPRRVSGTP